jgi:hypothetical protein
VWGSPKRVEVPTGINAGDQVILNPPVSLVDGSKVKARRIIARTPSQLQSVSGRLCHQSTLDN